LIHLLEEMQNKCIELNEFLDYDFEDDSLDGLLTLSDKGVHLAPRYSWNSHLFGTASSSTHIRFIRDFEEGEFLTSLTQALHPPQ
jgi:hypothetical protein